MDEHAPAVVNRGLKPLDKVDDSAGKTVERAPVARLDDEARANALEVVDLAGPGLVRRRWRSRVRHGCIVDLWPGRRRKREGGLVVWRAERERGGSVRELVGLLD